MTLKPGPHGRTWIMDDDKVVIWIYSEEKAKELLFNLENS